MKALGWILLVASTLANVLHSVVVHEPEPQRTIRAEGNITMFLFGAVIVLLSEIRDELRRRRP